jgi:hypothetical protein
MGRAADTVNPYTDLAELDFYASVGGQPFNLSPGSIVCDPVSWILRPRNRAWWREASIERDGMPTPHELRR